MFKGKVVLDIFKKFFSKFSFIKESFNRCIKGEENLNKLLWFWCLIPNIIVIVIIAKFFNFLKYDIVKVLYIIYNLICLYFILKALSVHPEYDVTRTQRIKENEYLKTLSQEELKKYKSEKKVENTKDFFRKALLLKSWKTVEFYKTVRLIIIFIILVTFKNLIY